MSCRIKTVNASATVAAIASTISRLIGGVGLMSSSIEIDGSGTAADVVGLVAKATLAGAGAD